MKLLMKIQGISSIEYWTEIDNQFSHSKFRNYGKTKVIIHSGKEVEYSSGGRTGMSILSLLVLRRFLGFSSTLDILAYFNTIGFLWGLTNSSKEKSPGLTC
jgi:hypothetical protein